MKVFYCFYFVMIVSLTSCVQNTPQDIEKTPWGSEVFTPPAFKDIVYSIVDFDAKKDSSFNNQQSIQNAIDKCNDEGGGRVIVPKGTWHTSYLILKSNVNLHLEEGAVLLFIDNVDEYKIPTFTRWEGIECMNYHPLIYARNETNIAITGSGIINGNGEKWWNFPKEGKQKKSLSELYDQVLEGVIPEERNCLLYEEGSFLRPSMIQFISCENVLMKDIEVQSGPMWTNHFIYCTNVIAQNIRVITRGTNNDGFVVDASAKVLIDNCFFSTGDDCVVIKSGLNEDGWRVGKPSERIVVKNCSTQRGNGGVVIGSEMSGGIENVYAYNCNFHKTSRGLRIKTMKGRGGYVKDVWFENITMDSIYNQAVIINMFYGSSSIEPRNDSLPFVKNIFYKNIVSTNSRLTLNLIGHPELSIDSIFFENCSFTGKRGIQIVDAQNIFFNNMSIESRQTEPLSITNSKNIVFDRLKASHFPLEN
jgi:polygalacturonase